MRKIFLLLVILAMLAREIRPQEDPNNDLGELNLTTVTNDDPNSCLVTLSVQLHENYIEFNQTIIQNPLPDCTHHDLQLFSYFRGDNINSSVQLVNTSNPNITTGNLTLDNITALNGTACMSYGRQVVGMNYYGCRFIFNGLKFVVHFSIIPGSGLINSTWYNLFNPDLGSTIANVSGINVWNRPVWSYPNILGVIYNACGGWSNSINNLNTSFVVTGMDLNQYLLNLQNYFANESARPMWIRQKGNNTANYIAYNDADPNWHIFGANPVNSCSDSGRKYSDFLPNLQYCQAGCDVSFAMINDGEHIVQTNGFVTVPSRRNLRS